MTGMGMGLASSRNRCFQREFQNLGSFPSLLGEIHLNPLFLKCLDELPNFFPVFRGQFLHPGPGMLGAGGRSQGSRLPGSGWTSRHGWLGRRCRGAGGRYRNQVRNQVRNWKITTFFCWIYREYSGNIMGY